MQKTNDQLHIFLLAGQSNMAGRGPLHEVEAIKDERILMFRDNTWMQAVEPLHQDKASAGVGLSMSFAKELLVHWPHALIGLVPTAVGGTPLARWLPREDLHENALDMVRAASANGILRGILWHQGETDAQSEENASIYFERFLAMVAGFRATLGEVPVVVGQLGLFLKAAKSFTHVAEVNQGLQRAANELTDCGFVATDGLEDHGDQVHFDATSLREFGRRYAAVFLDLVKGGAA